MRLRNKNWTTKFLEDKVDYLIDNNILFEENKVFKNNNDVFLEIGCGKGSFITEKSLIQSNCNFIAMEKERTVIGVALRESLKKYKENKKDLKNLRFLNDKIEKFEKNFATGSVSGIYLNFSDPWPKARHAKHRLTGRKFLKIYDRILKDDGEIHIKTDNDKLFKFTLDESIFSNFKVKLKESDLYSNEELKADNISTEYERKFVEMGFKIKKVILCKKNPYKKDI